jgi:hypothetical protein
MRAVGLPGRQGTLLTLIHITRSQVFRLSLVWCPPIRMSSQVSPAKGRKVPEAAAVSRVRAEVVPTATIRPPCRRRCPSTATDPARGPTGPDRPNPPALRAGSDQPAESLVQRAASARAPIRPAVGSSSVDGFRLGNSRRESGRVAFCQQPCLPPDPGVTSRLSAAFRHDEANFLLNVIRSPLRGLSSPTPEERPGRHGALLIAMRSERSLPTTTGQVSRTPSGAEITDRLGADSSEEFRSLPALGWRPGILIATDRAASS